MSRRQSWNEGRSIHIGINEVSNDVFLGYLPSLSSAENDARAMRDWANDVGCSARVVLGDDATLENVENVIDATIERLIPGDLLMITFAGHGLSLRGVATDRDGWDEAWCLHDGVLLDDVIHNKLVSIPKDCEVVVVTDACFAAGVIDDERRPLQLTGAAPQDRGISIDFDQIAKRPPVRIPGGIDATKNYLLMTGIDESGTAIPRAPLTRAADDAIASLLLQGKIPSGPIRRGGRLIPIQANLIAMSAAAENELAFEGPKHGLFTAAILSILDLPNSELLSYSKIMNLASELIVVQTPTLGAIGANIRTVSVAPALELAGIKLIQSAQSSSQSTTINDDTNYSASKAIAPQIAFRFLY